MVRPAMGRLKLRSASADSQRLGELIARAKQGIVSEREEIELNQLLKKATAVSRANVRTLEELRGEEPVQPEKKALKQKSR
jgi:hypothetical protein